MAGLAAADAGSYSEANKIAAYKMGVKPRVDAESIDQRRRLQQRRWFRKGQRGGPAAKVGSACPKDDTV